MTDSAVSERRIRPIQDAVASKNWKQALQLCEKWQKKGEKSDRFLALKASILVNQPEPLQIEKGKNETLQLCRRAVPITDIESLFQLQENLKKLSLENAEGPKLWDRAVSALPDDKDLTMTWLKSSISDNNWLMAQKATTALRKASPKERQYDFWNIIFCYMIHQHESLSEKDRTLFGTLAYRLISKAADAVSSDDTQVLTTGKAIITPDEVALLVGIYNRTGHAFEATQLLRGQKLGIESRIAESDPSMVLSLLLDTLGFCTDSTLVMNTCVSLLDDENPKGKEYAEDDRLWSTLLRVCKRDPGSQQYRDTLMRSVNSVIARQPDCRAAYLAKLNVLVGDVEDDKQEKKQELFDAVQQYYKQFPAKPFTFDDLARAVHHCKPHGLGEILPDLASADASGRQLALGLRFEYSMLSEESSDEQAFLSFTSKAIRLHDRLQKEKIDDPEIVLLAALSLLQLASITQNLCLTAQAGCLLANAYDKFGECYPLAVRLIQVQRALGHMSMAQDTFASLSVKNMQWETVGHLLMTRISSLHPFPSRNSDSGMNPLQALDIALEMSERMEDSLNKAIQKGLENGAYSNVLDTVAVKRNVRQSLNRHIYVVEERRIQNLAGVPLDIHGEDIALKDAPRMLHDFRDFDFVNTYHANDNRMQSFLSCGPLPKEAWLCSMAFSDHISTFLKSELNGQSLYSAQAYKSIQTSLDQINRLERELTQELTDAERSSLDCHRHLGRTIVLLKDPSTQQADVDESVDRMLAWTTSLQPTSTETINGVEIPNWEFLHTCFSQLQTIQILFNFVGVFGRKTKSSKSKGVEMSKQKAAELQKAVLDAEDKICQRAKQVRDGLNAPGVLGKLLEVVAGRLEEGPLADVEEYKILAEDCARLSDESILEEYCGNMRDSWEDALGGVLTVKIAVPK